MKIWLTVCGSLARASRWRTWRPGLLRLNDPERPVFLVLSAKRMPEFHWNSGIDQAGDRPAGTL
jgi:hypothetical protein